MPGKSSTKPGFPVLERMDQLKWTQNPGILGKNWPIPSQMVVEMDWVLMVYNAIVYLEF